jgi:hypothetical protein
MGQSIVPHSHQRLRFVEIVEQIDMRVGKYCFLQHRRCRTNALPVF